MNCAENETHQFSHDDNINTWVKEHRQEISKYNRKDIISFEYKKQKAILNAMSPIKRKSVWQEKVNYILDLDLSKDEKEYLKWFGKAFKTMDYETTISQEFSDLLYERVKGGIEKFNWSAEFVFTIFFTVGDLDEKKIKLKSSSHNQKIQEEPDTCTCYYDGGCPGWWNTCSEPDQCKNANTDCGVFGGTTCDGYCTDDIW